MNNDLGCMCGEYYILSRYQYFRYEWLPTERLPELSIQRLAAKGALVAVWVTNKRKLTMFIRQKLFPKWNICYQAEWHWLKVCLVKLSVKVLV